MIDPPTDGVSRQSGIVSLARASIAQLLPACVIYLLAACSPANPPGAPAAWTGQASVDPLTDATVTTAMTQVWDATGSFFAEVTLTCTAANGEAAFIATAGFFDKRGVGTPLLVEPRRGPQDLAILRVGDLEAVTLGLGSLSNYSNQLSVLSGTAAAQSGGDLHRYAMISQLPNTDRLVLRPTLTTGEPTFTISLTEAPALRQVFANCAPAFQRFDELARQELAQRQVRQEQADLYARRPPDAEDHPPVLPRREDFEQRAAQAEADCLQRYNVTEDPTNNATRSMCAEVGERWRQDFVNAASAYADRVRTRHYREFGHHRWAAESRAAAACLRQYEEERHAAGTPEAADSAAQAALDCYVAAGNPPPEP